MGFLEGVNDGVIEGLRVGLLEGIVVGVFTGGKEGLELGSDGHQVRRQTDSEQATA